MSDFSLPIEDGCIFRHFTSDVEKRRAKDDDDLYLVGHAAVFDQETRIGNWYREVIAKGAFQDAIKRKDDAVFVVNHSGMPMARVSGGTLDLEEDDYGLLMTALLDTGDPFSMSVVSRVERGDLNQMSFAASVTEEEWEKPPKDSKETLYLRTIKSVELYDVSAVNFGQWDTTDIAKRSVAAGKKSLDDWLARREAEKVAKHNYRAARDRLARSVRRRRLAQIGERMNNNGTGA